jgi:hypothetical protein
MYVHAFLNLKLDKIYFSLIIFSLKICGFLMNVCDIIMPKPRQTLGHGDFSNVFNYYAWKIIHRAFHSFQSPKTLPIILKDRRMKEYL